MSHFSIHFFLNLAFISLPLTYNEFLGYRCASNNTDQTLCKSQVTSIFIIADDHVHVFKKKNIEICSKP